MKLTIFGATGGTGKQLVEQALAAGNYVVAYVRNPSRARKRELAQRAYNKVISRIKEIRNPSPLRLTRYE